MGTAADLAPCAALVGPFELPADLRARLGEFWAGIIGAYAHTFGVIEDLELEFPRNIEGFGLSVFLTDACMGELAQSPRPYVAAQLYRRMLAGEEVLLTREGLAQANAGPGLNVLSLHPGLRIPDFGDPRTVEALKVFSAGFHFFHSGYRLKSIAGEVFGPQAAAYMAAGGFRHAPYAGQCAESEPGADAPAFFVLRRDWLDPGAINPLTQLFEPSPPRIGFSPAEQRLLERALLGEADASVAAALGVSMNAIKRTWRSLFERVARAAPFLLPAQSAEDEWRTSGGRGLEKRRALLDYLRTHMEELRPRK